MKTGHYEKQKMNHFLRSTFLEGPPLFRSDQPPFRLKGFHQGIPAASLFLNPFILDFGDFSSRG